MRVKDHIAISSHIKQKGIPILQYAREGDVSVDDDILLSVEKVEALIVELATMVQVIKVSQLDRLIKGE